MCYLRLHRLIRIGIRRFNLPYQVIWNQIYRNALPLITRNKIPWHLRDEELSIYLQNNGVFKNA